MPQRLPSFDLNRVGVSKPCPADWDAMEGDERVRFCQQCSMHVYNLSGMTEAEAIDLVQAREGGRLCVRFFRRPDGTMLTDACPVGLEAARRRVRRWVAAATALFAGATSWFSYGIAQEKQLPTILGAPTVPTPPPRQFVMGDMMVAPPPAAQGAGGTSASPDGGCGTDADGTGGLDLPDIDLR